MFFSINVTLHSNLDYMWYEDITNDQLSSTLSDMLAREYWNISSSITMEISPLYAESQRCS